MKLIRKVLPGGESGRPVSTTINRNNPSTSRSQVRKKKRKVRRTNDGLTQAETILGDRLGGD